jgi:hypothetical protein
LGSYYNNTQHPNAAYSEFALFDSVLTAEEVAALYQRNAPLVDAGARDTPGIYILDGRFQIASGTTGNRMEFSASELAIYEEGVKDCWIGLDGWHFEQGEGDINSIKWEDNGTQIGSLHTSWGGGAGDPIVVFLRADESGVSANDAMVRLRAYDGSIDVDFTVSANQTVNGVNVTDFIINDGSIDWLDFGNAQNCDLILGDKTGSYAFRVLDSDSSAVINISSDGTIAIEELEARDYIKVTQGGTDFITLSDTGLIECDEIRTNSGEDWNLGGTASGTVTADYKIHVEIDSQWYTINAKQGLH